MSSLSAAVLATQGFKDIRDSVLLAPTLDFALEPVLVLPGAGTRTVRQLRPSSSTEMPGEMDMAVMKEGNKEKRN